MFPELNFTPCTLKVKSEDGHTHVWGLVRNRYLKLTKEEWVRQHLINHLHQVKKFPLSLMSVEQKTGHQQRALRTDVIAYNSVGIPLILAECKAFDVSLSQEVLSQIANYNKDIGARYLLLTNGLEHYVLTLNRLEGKWEFLKDIPVYTEE
ncbi:MAG: type I restriction enzyme HsdR N-terminal domain-containing protein [Flavobacteriales bacterium]|nr:type I restriction enzyme HsdR N-terminal domain-containing protein [Flavobacteriales bacterium]